MSIETRPRPIRERLVTGWAAVLLGWLITVADAVLPLPASQPLGLTAFLVSSGGSIAANVVAIVIAGGALHVLLLRRQLSSTAVTRSAGSAVLIAAAIASFGAERIVGLISVLS